MRSLALQSSELLLATMNTELSAVMESSDIWDARIHLLDIAAQEEGSSTLARIEAAIEEMKLDGHHNQSFWLHPALARALALSGQLDRAEAVVSDAYAYFRKAGSGRGQALAMIAGATVAFAKGQSEVALAQVTRAANLAALVTEAALQVRVASARGALLIEVGRVAEAIEVLELGLESACEATEEPATLRLKAHLALANSTQAIQARDKGQYDDFWRRRAERAIELVDPLLSQQRSRGRRGQLCALWSIRALAHLALDQLPDAHKALDEAVRELPFSDIRSRSVVILPTLRGRAHLQAGEFLLALRSIDEALNICDENRPAAGHDEVFRLKSLIHERLGEIDQAFTAYKQFHELREQSVLERVERIHGESRHDALTGLANRRHFDEYLARAVSRASEERPVSLMLLDLDHFKAINDGYGHIAGDAALRWVSMHLEAVCRQTEFPARLGGDEFALVLTAPPQVARQVFERLRAAMKTGVEELPAEVRLTFSAGIAQSSRNCKASRLIALADQALYVAKSAGRDDVHVNATSA